jgi:hypothetical protein
VFDFGRRPLDGCRLPSHEVAAPVSADERRAAALPPSLRGDADFATAKSAAARPRPSREFFLRSSPTFGRMTRNAIANWDPVFVICRRPILSGGAQAISGAQKRRYYSPRPTLRGLAAESAGDSGVALARQWSTEQFGSASIERVLLPRGRRPTGPGRQNQPALDCSSTLHISNYQGSAATFEALRPSLERRAQRPAFYLVNLRHRPRISSRPRGWWGPALPQVKYYAVRSRTFGSSASNPNLRTPSAEVAHRR